MEQAQRAISDMDNRLIKIYKYSEQAIIESGFKPDQSLRLDKEIIVKNFADADFILVNANLAEFKSRDDMKRLPLFESLEDKHVFFSCGEYEIVYGTTAILIQCDLRTWKLAKDINSKACAWPVGKEDIDNCAEEVEFTHDVGFHGWMSSESRHLSVKSVELEFGKTFDSACYPDFAGYLYKDGKPTEEFIRRRGLFLNSLKHCRIQLCPQSRDGVQPYRFWETMCAGKVAALVCSGDVRPRADEIDYDEFVLTIPADQASEAGIIIKRYLSENTDEMLIEKGKKARKAYIEKLDSRNWDKFFRETLEKHLWNLK